MEQIVATMLGLVEPVAVTEVPIASSLGCVLGRPVTAQDDLPQWPVATRDGFAMPAADLRSAVTVLTGAPLPRGADTVIARENWLGVQNRSAGPVRSGENVAPPGSEFRSGATVLGAGSVLRPPELAVLAALGLTRVPVIPPPRAAIVVTGSELSWQVGRPQSGQVYASNVALVEGMVVASGATVHSVRVVADEPAELEGAFWAGLDADLILTTGGTGRSSRDIVGNVLREQEVASLWQTRVAGSKSAAFRVLRQARTERLVPHLALPGRPIAAMISFILFGHPLLRHLAGLVPTGGRYVWAVLGDGIEGSDGRHRYIPVRLERHGKRWEARLAGDSSLYGLAAMVGIDGFAVLGPRTGKVSRGERVRLLLPPW